MSIADLVNGLKEFVFNVLNVFVNGLVGIITSPINSLLKNTIPNFSQFGIFLNNTLKSLLSYMAWLCDALMIDRATLVFVTSVIVFAITVTIAAWFLKVIIRWYHILMP